MVSRVVKTIENVCMVKIYVNAKSLSVSVTVKNLMPMLY